MIRNNFAFASMISSYYLPAKTEIAWKYKEVLIKKNVFRLHCLKIQYFLVEKSGLVIKKNDHTSKLILF